MDSHSYVFYRLDPRYDRRHPQADRIPPAFLPPGRRRGAFSFLAALWKRYGYRRLCEALPEAPGARVSAHPAGAVPSGGGTSPHRGLGTQARRGSFFHRGFRLSAPPERSAQAGRATPGYRSSRRNGTGFKGGAEETPKRAGRNPICRIIRINDGKGRSLSGTRSNGSMPRRSLPRGQDGWPERSSRRQRRGVFPSGRTRCSYRPSWDWTCTRRFPRSFIRSSRRFTYFSIRSKGRHSLPGRQDLPGFGAPADIPTTRNTDHFPEAPLGTGLAISHNRERRFPGRVSQAGPRMRRRRQGRRKRWT